MPVLDRIMACMACLLLAAHSLRSDHFWSLALWLLAGAVAWLPHRWAVHFLSLALGVGLLLWVKTAIFLLRLRLALHEPWLRLALILGVVILFHVGTLIMICKRVLARDH